ncbi:hypothetical protein I350_04070 [Cryptococcus amylolentus CBS 6273]|uniref:ZZ-type domain-containing protein n=1 Tax=Cryptococcus amylolentus CBS 6273 TaxID=1296118 RepID=A0A1E3K3B6_9TREE|nr:hypothetical protein I350_04070 [Cryptococcus amylolentus CBS 6273]
MFVIKATLKDETRRLSFHTTRFPRYSDVQEKIRTIFNLPSTSHPYWVNVLLFPDDSRDARIMFKQHVCDVEEYESAQLPFVQTIGTSPALVFTVLLTSDPRLDSIHGFHRANRLISSFQASTMRLQVKENELVHECALLTALEAKVQDCMQVGDQTGIAFWSSRAQDKRNKVASFEETVKQMRHDIEQINQQLDNVPTEGYSHSSLRDHAQALGREETLRAQQTAEELEAWRLGEELNQQDEGAFPPLEAVINGGRRGRHHPHGPGFFRPSFPGMPPPPPHGHPRAFPFSHFPPPPHPPAFGPPFSHERMQNHERKIKGILDSVTEILNPSNPNGLVPAQEIKSMLDGFLGNLTNQLAGTFEGSPSVSSAMPEAEPKIPGAFVSSPVQNDVSTQTTPAEKTTPATKLGQGGFRHRHIWCDGCEQEIRGMRYKCEQCSDYDLCGSCLPLLNTAALHPVTHSFKAMLHRDLQDRIKLTADGLADESQMHPATCDVCSRNILGVRWKCLNCPDWDACGVCAQGLGQKHPGHSFVKLYKAGDYVTDKGMEARDQVAHPHVSCDGCEARIHGIRYKCMHPSCPDYDLCQACEAHPATVHPVDHPMLKLKAPLRVKFQSSYEQKTRSHALSTSSPAKESPSPEMAQSDKMTTTAASFKANKVKPHGDAFGARTGGQWQQHVEHSPAPGARAKVVEDLLSWAGPSDFKKEEQPETPKAEKKEIFAVNPAPEVKAEVPAKAEEAPEPAKVETRTPEPAKEPVGPLDIFSYVRHVTIPPGTSLPAGTVFTKIWKYKHFASGDEYPFGSIHLEHQSGQSLSGGVEGCNVKFVIDKNDVKEGEEGEVRIEGLKVPERKGEVLEWWRFVDEKGVQYGQPFRLRIAVAEDLAASRNMSASSFIMPSSTSTPEPVAPKQDGSVPCGTLYHHYKTPAAGADKGASTESSQYLSPPSSPSLPSVTSRSRSRSVMDDDDDDDDDLSVVSYDSYVDVEGVKTGTTQSVTSGLADDGEEGEAVEAGSDEEFQVVEDSEEEMTADELENA